MTRDGTDHLLKSSPSLLSKDLEKGGIGLVGGGILLGSLDKGNRLVTGLSSSLSSRVESNAQQSGLGSLVKQVEK